MRRIAGGIVVCIAPVLAALYVGAKTFGGTLIPWQAVMVDLGVYRAAGQALLTGGNPYQLPGDLPFLYPPFAAVLSVPLAIAPQAMAEIGWTVAGALALTAVIHRFSLTGWTLSLAATVAVLVVEPVTQTFAFGQLGIVLVALVVLDLAPGPTVLGRRLLPRGTLTALAAALKLTPAIFVGYLLFTRQYRAFVTALVAFAAVTLGSAAVAPAVSAEFWGRLAHGDTGLGHSIIYYTNQSVMADVVRILGLGRGVALLGLTMSAAVALLGLIAGVLWHRLGDQGAVWMALNLCGIASLLASPVSWLHHFVWIVPLALGVAYEARKPASVVPSWLAVIASAFVVWVAVAPFTRLPNGGDVELLWTWDQQLLASVTAIVGVALLVGAVVVALRAGRKGAPSPVTSTPSTPRTVVV